MNDFYIMLILCLFVYFYINYFNFTRTLQYWKIEQRLKHYKILPLVVQCFDNGLFRNDEYVVSSFLSITFWTGKTFLCITKLPWSIFISPSSEIISLGTGPDWFSSSIWTSSSGHSSGSVLDGIIKNFQIRINENQNNLIYTISFKTHMPFKNS